jgi:hypothetical protein
MPASCVTIDAARKARELRKRERLGWDDLAKRFGTTPRTLRAAIDRANAVDAATRAGARAECTAVGRPA